MRPNVKRFMCFENKGLRRKSAHDKLWAAQLVDLIGTAKHNILYQETPVPTTSC